MNSNELDQYQRTKQPTGPMSPGHVAAHSYVSTRTDPKGKTFTSYVRTDQIEVEIWTTRGSVHGFLHVLPGLRVKDMLNNPDEEFLAVTEADLVMSEGTGGTRHVDFIALNKQYVITVIPIDEESKVTPREEYVAY